jgi:hypothetical protein
MATLTLISSQNNQTNNLDKICYSKIVEEIYATVSSTDLDISGFDDYERSILEICNEVGRRVLEKKLKELSSRHQDEALLVDGVRYKRHNNGEVEYHSLCGSMKVSRYTYRQTGVRNGPTIVPLELVANLQERATPALVYRIALGDAQCPGRQWEDQLWASHRKPPARSTLERIAKKIGTTAKNEMPRILPLVRAEEIVSTDAVAVSVGLDRTTIPMEEALRFRGNIVPPKRRKKPYVRKAPDPVTVNYRMAYVGTVSISGPDGENIHTTRYGCSADQDPSEILGHMMDDLMQIQSHRKKCHLPTLPMGIIQDGAPEMWNLMESEVKKAFPNERFEKAIDRFHLAERLAESLKVLQDPFVDRDVRMREWSDALDCRDSAIDEIEKFILTEKKRLEKHRPLSSANAEILRTHLAYIKNNKHLMRYAKLKKLGLPTGSGATEGACKSLIMIRAKGCGQRWHSTGVNSVLTLRGLYQSERLERFWVKMNEQQRVCIQKAA